MVSTRVAKPNGCKLRLRVYYGLQDAHPSCRFESYFGRSAYAHLFVTNAMRDRLVKDWDLQWVVLSPHPYLSH